MAGIWDSVNSSIFNPEKINSPGLLSDVRRTIGQQIAGTGSTLQDLGAENVGAGLEQYGAGIVRRNPSEIQSFQDVLAHPYTTAREAVGEIAPQVGLAVGGQMAGRFVGGLAGAPFGPLGVMAGQQIGGLVGGLAPIAAQTYGGIRSEQRQQGIEDIPRAIGATIPSVALERFGGAERIAAKVAGQGTNFLAREAGESLWKAVSKQVLRGGAEEALTEIPQTALERYGAYQDVTGSDAYSDYGVSGVKAFLGGGAVRGGMSAVAGTRPAPGQEFDLTQKAPQQYGLVTQPAPLQERIDKRLGIGVKTTPSDYAKQFEEAYNEPSGQYVTDPATGLEKQLSVGEYNQMQGAPLDLTQPAPAGAAAAATTTAKVERDPRSYELRDTFGVIPTPSSLQLYSDIQASGIPVDSDLLGDVWKFAGDKPMTPKRLERAQQLLDAAIINARKEAPVGTAVPVVSQPAGSVGVGGPVVQGAVGVAGSNAPIQGPVAGSPAAAGEAPQQTGVLPSAAPQPAATVDTQAPVVTPTAPVVTQAAPVPGSKFRRAPKPMTVLEAANAAKAAQAQQAETQGSQAPAAPESDVAPEVAATADKAKAEIVRVFGERDANILYDAFVEKLPHADIATKYGVGRTTVVKVAGDGEGAQQFRAEKMKAAGGSEATLRSAFDVLSQATRQQALAESANQTTTLDETELDKDLQTAGLTTIATEGGSQSEWKDTTDAVGQRTQEIYELSQKVDELQEKVQVARDAGYDTVATKNGKMSLEDAEGEITVLKLKIQQKTDTLKTAMEIARSGGGKVKRTKTAPKDTKGKASPEIELESDADVAAREAAEKARAERAAKVAADRKGLKVGDTVTNPKLGTGTVKSFAGDGDAATVTVAFKSGQTKELSLKLALLEKTNAVQVESTTGVSVQSETQAGQGVGKQVRRAEKPAAESKAAAPAKILTEAEQAAQAWDVVAAEYPTAPKFADLTKDQQQDFIEFGPGNWGKEDVQLELTKLAKAESSDKMAERVLRLVRGDTVEVTAGSVKFDGDVTDENSLRRFPGVDSALRHYENNNLRHVIDAVELWMVAPNSVDFDAAVMIVDGKQTVAVRSGVLTDTSRVEWAMHHELGHIADEASRFGGIYSSAPELNLGIRNGKVMPMGKVVREIADFIKANPTSGFAKTMAYPLDHATHSSLSADETRMEVFAQLWATFNTQEGNIFLEENLPSTFDFMEINNEAAKQDQGGAGTETGAAATQAPQQIQANRGTQGVPRAILRIARPNQGLIDRNINKLPKTLQQPAKNIVGSLGDLAGSGLDYVVFTGDLIGRAVKAGMPAAQKFANALANSKAAASVRERRIEKIADMYANVEDQFKGSGPGTVNEFLFESTRTGKWGYGKYADKAMAAQFDALGPNAQAFVKAVFGHGDQILSEKKQIVMNAATSEYDAMIAAAQKAGDAETESALKREKAATLKRFQTLFKIREGLPYAPIRRTGPWAVVSRSQEYMDAVANNDTELVRKLEQNPDHYQVSFVDTKNQARSLEAEIGDQFSGLETTISKRAEAMDDFSGQALLPALTAIRSKVDSEQGTSNTKLLNIISQLYLESLAEDSARKSEMRRRGISGQVDMLSSFTTQGRADANFLASVQYSPEIQDSLQQMRKQSKSGDVTRRTEIFDELSKRYVESLDYNVNPWISKLTNLSSKYFLATSPGYYIQNLTQPFMMSVPAMAGKHDYATVGSTLWKAYSELGPLFKNTKLFDQQFDFSQVPDDVKKAVDELVQRGKIDIGLATEINEYKVDADNDLSQFASKLNKGMRLAVQKTEAINRLSTAMAAYRLEIAAGRSHEAAVAYADRILTETHGDYTAFNAPRIFNSNFGKIALQFRKFQLVQMAFYAKLLRDAFTNPAERKAALRTLGYSVAHNGVFAGALGIPGYAAAAALAGMLFGSDDEPYDLTEEMRKALGPEWSQLIMRGAPTLIGMDLSGKIGAGQMLSVAPFMDVDLTTQRGVQQAIGAIAGGATGGMAGKMLDGLSLMMSGDIYRGLEQTLPKGIADMLKAGRLTSEGLTRRNGDVLLSEKDVSEVGVVWAAIGLPSAQVAETYQRQQYAKNLETNLTERATKIRNEYAKAYRSKDSEGMAQARAEWTKLQQARVRNELKAQPMSSLLKAPQAQAKREKKIAAQLD